MKKFLIPLVAGLSLSGPVFAESVPWGEAGNWVILVNTADNSCFAEAKYSDGTFVQIGFRANKEKAFLASFNPVWDKHEIDKTFPVMISLDDDMFEGEAHRRVLEDMAGAEIDFDNPDFLIDLAKKNVVTVSSDGEEKLQLGLEGSMEAIEALGLCQAEQG